MPRSGIGLNDLLGRLQGSAGQHMRRPPYPKAQTPGRDPMMPRQSPALKRKTSRKAVTARKHERSRANREIGPWGIRERQAAARRMHGAERTSTTRQTRSRTY